MPWLLRLLKVSFADFDAAGQQPAEYPDPGPIQDVDRNERIYGGRRPFRGKSGLAPTDAQPVGAELRGQSKPPVKGLSRFGPTCSWVSLLPLFEEKDQVPARERYPLVLQLDTFVETTRRKPPLRGPRLHVL